MTRLGLFGSHVLRCSEHLASVGIGRPAALEQLSETKIDDTRYEVFASELTGPGRRGVELLRILFGRLKDHIVGLQISMEHTAIVSVLHRLGNDSNEASGLADGDGKGLLIQSLTEG
jgi:hypothetical protein